MTLSIVSTNKDPEPWIVALQEIDPSLDIQVWPHEPEKSDVTFALCWKHPEGVLGDYPNLKCICSMGAGVDHLLNDPFLPQDIPVIRLVDPLLAQSMFEYICAAVMDFVRDFGVYRIQQQRSHWQPQVPKAISQMTIGLMGLGTLGEYSAVKFSAMGFNVVGWSRSPKSIPGVETYAGPAQLTSFLSQTNVLVCLLPLTPQTQGILNLDLFNALPNGACLVNVARGEHLVEADLIMALDNQQLQGAYLDVFQQEPLPKSHPFWTHEKIRVTPHCSSITDPRSVAPQIVDNYRLMQTGGPLLNQVDIARGY